ncbi:DUF559 domain-containing protein [Novosphingobium sp.]|uniref:endonuclease domain-containing protein n=1 Tax=Novosphingobium sp. TaxID=1874826 RepID=UPI00286BA97C|nr:DUF559 domain-containing protein [Novosphingobium sp.]
MRNQGEFRDRDTNRARELRNAATPAGPFYADFLCRELMLIVELDGFSHDVQPERDIYRDRYLVEHGYRVLHFTNAEVLGNVEGVATAIIRALADWPTPNPSRKREGGI